MRQIDVQYAGKPSISRERILANMRTTVGQPFSQPNAEEDIRNLYATGEITNVRIFSEPLSDGVKVIVIVQTRSMIKTIFVNGVTPSVGHKLLKTITSKKGKILSEQTVEEDRQKMVDYFHDHGFQNVDVKSDIAMDDKDNTATITFTVNQGQRGVLRSVRFEGNQRIKSRDLRHAMKGTRGKDIVSFIDKSGRLDQSKLHEDLDAIRDLYQSKGYIDVEIPETRVEKLANGDLNLVVVIREGVLYHVGTLAFQGTQIFTPSEIRRFLKMKEAAIYSPKGLERRRQDDPGLLWLARLRGRPYHAGGKPQRSGPREPDLQGRGRRPILRGPRQYCGQYRDEGQGHPPGNPDCARATFTTLSSWTPPRSVWRISATLKRWMPRPRTRKWPTARIWTCWCRKSALVP